MCNVALLSLAVYANCIGSWIKLYISLFPFALDLHRRFPIVPVLHRITARNSTTKHSIAGVNYIHHFWVDEPSARLRPQASDVVVLRRHLTPRVCARLQRHTKFIDICH